MTGHNHPVLASQEQRATLRYPDTNDYSQGPAVGESLPDFTLPDQQGKLVHYGSTRGNDKALVVFHRSARW